MGRLLLPQSGGGRTTATLSYQRELSSGYFDVFNGAGGAWQPVAATLPVRVE